MSPVNSPPGGPTVLTAIRWVELFPWLLLVRAARVALMGRVLALAIAGVIATQIGWSAIDAVVPDPADRGELVPLTHRPPPRLWNPRVTGSPALITVVPQAEADRPPSGDFADLERVVASRLNWSRLFDGVDARRYAGPLVRGWAWAMQPFARLIDASNWQEWVALLLAAAWSVSVWGIFGGAIARIAALYLTRDERMGPWAALKAAVVRWPSITGAPAFCLLLIAILALLLALAGFCARAGIFASLIGLFWILFIIVGVGIALLGIGLFVGWPFMWSTAAVERSDAFEGVSRGYAYVYQRPLHLLFFLLVATVIGLLAQAAVSIVTDASLKATHWGFRAGAGDDRMSDLYPPPSQLDDDEQAREVGMLTAVGGKAMRFWTIGVLWVAAAFPMAYLWPATTGIYLLQRRAIDATDLSESAEDETAVAENLPPLATDDKTSVPQVQREGEPGAHPS